MKPISQNFQQHLTQHEIQTSLPTIFVYYAYIGDNKIEGDLFN